MVKYIVYVVRGEEIIKSQYLCILTSDLETYYYNNRKNKLWYPRKQFTERFIRELKSLGCFDKFHLFDNEKDGIHSNICRNILSRKDKKERIRLLKEYEETKTNKLIYYKEL